MVAAALLGCGWLAGQMTGRHELRGRVVDGESGRAVTDVDVSLLDLQWREVGEPAVPDAQGRFGFAGLAAGQYMLRASRPGMGGIHYGEKPESDSAGMIQVGPEVKAPEVLFRLPGRAIVGGQVRDEWGDPVALAHVSLLRLSWMDGRNRLDIGSQAVSDDQGRYRIVRVVPGRYFVCVMPEPMVRRPPALAMGVLDVSAPVPPTTYAQACSPRLEGRASSPLLLKAHQSAEVNVTLEPVAVATISGQVLNVREGQAPSLVLRREDGHRFMASASELELPSGGFAFRNVAPGAYWVEASQHGPEGEEQRARARVLVADGDVRGVSLPLLPVFALAGRLRSVPGSSVPFASVQVSLRPQDAPDEPVWGDVNPDLNLRFPVLTPGVYWLVARTNGSHCPTSVKLGGVEFLHQPIPLPGGALPPLEVTFSDQCGGIEGRVVNGGKPVARAMVLLLLSGSVKAPGDMLTTDTEEDGSFRFPGLTPHRYLLWAWETSNGAVGPESISKVASQATTLTATAGKTAAVTLTALPLPEGHP